jgi:type II secretory pathway component GspD/PulD (secretin)
MPHRTGMVLLLWCLAAPLAAQDTTVVRETPEGFLVDFQNQDLRVVISALAEAAGLNVSYGVLPQRRGTLRMGQAISRAEIPAVLRTIVEANGLRMTQQGPLILIEAATPQTAAQQATAAAQQAQPVDLRLFVYRLRHANAVQLAQTLAGVFAGERPAAPARGGDEEGETIERAPAFRSTASVIGSAAGNLQAPLRIVADETTNALLVRASDADWVIVQQAIEALDLRPLQVLIEGLIVEVRRTSDFYVGVGGRIEHTMTGAPSGTAVAQLAAPSLGDFVAQITGTNGANDINLALYALSARGNVSVQSLPVIYAQNNREARLIVGTEQPFISVFRTLPTDQSVRDQVVQYRDVGTELIITPTINPDGYVNLQVLQKASLATAEVQFGAPVIIKREAVTQVFARNKQTVVVGGLADRVEERTRTGIPVLRDIPLIGGLFGTTRRTTLVTELFLFLTPHVVENDADADRLRAALEETSRLLQEQLRRLPTLFPPDSTPADPARDR